MYENRLKKKNWIVRPITLDVAQEIVREFHYAHGGSNTAVYTHGLFRKGASFWDNQCVGIAWWIPPTKSAALATYPQFWQGVLALSRLVVLPEVPKNACSFLLAQSMKLIDREKWPCLVTYADEWQGHEGTIYKASNWEYAGKTNPEPVFLKNGRMVSRKAGPKTRTRKQMESIGARCVGSFSKHKFVHKVRSVHNNGVKPTFKGAGENCTVN